MVHISDMGFANLATLCVFFRLLYHCVLAVCRLSLTSILLHYSIFIQSFLGSVVNACISYGLYYIVLLITDSLLQEEHTAKFLTIKNQHVCTYKVWKSSGLCGLRGDPNYRGIRTTERKLHAVGNIQKL